MAFWGQGGDTTEKNYIYYKVNLKFNVSFTLLEMRNSGKKLELEIKQTILL